MKQFIYGSEVVGLPEWPSGTLRLEGIEVTTNPEEADIFVCPGALSMFQYNGSLLMDKLYQLPYFKGNESRSVFFDVSDNFKQAINLPIICIRCDARSWMLPTDTNTIQIAWPVEDYAECVELPEGGFKYDVSFQGWNWSDARRESIQSIRNNSILASDVADYPDFCGYLHDRATNQWTPEGIRRRAEFRRSMKESRIALCPESIPGVFPYRFFEAMSAGRVPLLVGSDYVFPFADSIPYRDFIIELHTSNASRAGDVAADFIRSHSDAQIIDLGLEARHYWAKYLDARLWPKTMAAAVTRKMESILQCR